MRYIRILLDTYRILLRRSCKLLVRLRAKGYGSVIKGLNSGTAPKFWFHYMPHSRDLSRGLLRLFYEFVLFKDR